MHTPGPDSDTIPHAIDPHPPREPRLIGLPTPPPEIGRGLENGDANLRNKEEIHNIACATDEISPSGISVAGERTLYIASEADDQHLGRHVGTALPGDMDKDKMPTADGLEVDVFKADISIPQQMTVDVASMPSPDSVAMGGEPEYMAATDEPSPAKSIDARLRGFSPQQVVKRSDDNDAGPAEGSGTPGAPVVAPEPSTTPLFDLSTKRLYPFYPSSFLRPGSKFSGTQQSEHQVYNVDVEVLTVSVPESTMTGYLRICGLTEDHPTLTTFFTGEIIGGPHHKYSFHTKHHNWGASDLTDLQHWAQFPAWRQLSQAAKGDINFRYPPAAQRPGHGQKSSTSTSTSSTPTDDAADYEYDSEASPGWWRQPNVFMRWKEWFLVPDHRVTTIPGASFEGFYYICFSQVQGKITGIYFHGKSKKYQQLELNHKFDRGVCGAMEFR